MQLLESRLTKKLRLVARGSFGPRRSPARTPGTVSVLLSEGPALQFPMSIDVESFENSRSSLGRSYLRERAQSEGIDHTA